MRDLCTDGYRYINCSFQETFFYISRYVTALSVKKTCDICCGVKKKKKKKMQPVPSVAIFICIIGRDL